MKRILYLGVFEIGKSETDSGVLYPAQKLAETFGGYSFLVTVKHNTKIEDINLWKQRIPTLNFVQLPSPEKAPRGFRTFYLQLLMKFCLKRLVKKYKPTHIYIRDCNYFSAAKYLARFSQAKVIFKVAGAIIPEAVMTAGRITPKIKILDRFIFSPAIRQADVLTAVSWRFKSYLEEMYFRSDTLVIPSTAVLRSHNYTASDNLKLKTSLGFASEDIVLCYSGGASIWQRGADMLHFFKQLHNAEPRIKLLIMSYSENEFRKLAFTENMDMKNIVICRVAREEIDRYYAIVDAGICLRHNNVVNNVASPFKIGEYWEAGIPVIMTRGIGDYSYEAIENKLGIVLPDDFLDDCKIVEKTVHFLLTMNRADIYSRCREWVKENISIESQLEMLKKLYQ